MVGSRIPNTTQGQISLGSKACFELPRKSTAVNLIEALELPDVVAIM